MPMSLLSVDADGSPRQRIDYLASVEQGIVQVLSGFKPGRSGSFSIQDQLHVVLASAAVSGLPAVSDSIIERVAAQLRSHNVIDEALERANNAHVKALRGAGLNESVLELLQSWVETMVETRLVQRQIEVERVIECVREQMPQAVSAALQDDPTRLLSAVAMGQELGGIGDESVRQREKAGELFSVLRPGRKRGREYPVFQAWGGISGEPLKQALDALGRPEGAAAYTFFTSPSDLLAGLSPMEAILGKLTSQRVLADDAAQFLSASPAERLEAVLQAAKAYAAVLAS
ncbi:hypothetical protein BVER_01483 [Candidatus Burkholderia verschuerenii]|uniref:Uncharacterized protein n=1 Tax=Candidatus Burkholderia verschuerenii TaxID=242163 RepID=A0A0L0MJ09_9BURK|nr:hypothetical protein [Candidatus Burkholderia verschuerenii]KND61979.1 hypothetical protein BVER_01483 [Candidatus Burkholderia verschuerenii]